MTSPEWLTSRYEYDVAGNVTKEYDPRGKLTTFSYVDSGTLIAGRMTYAFATTAVRPLEMTWTHRFDYYLGRPIQTTDPNSAATSYIWGAGSPDDLLDRLRRITYPIGG